MRQTFVMCDTKSDQRCSGSTARQLAGRHAQSPSRLAQQTTRSTAGHACRTHLDSHRLVSQLAQAHGGSPAVAQHQWLPVLVALNLQRGPKGSSGR